MALANMLHFHQTRIEGGDCLICEASLTIQKVDHNQNKLLRPIRITSLAGYLQMFDFETQSIFLAGSGRGGYKEIIV